MAFPSEGLGTLSFRIAGQTRSLIIDQGEDGLAHLVWFGPVADEAMRAEPAFKRLPASPDVPVGPALLPEAGRGFHGVAQVDAHCTVSRRRSRLQDFQIVQQEDAIAVEGRDRDLGMRTTTQLRFEGDLLVVTTSLTHEGSQPLDVTRIASALLPAPDWADTVMTQSGAWGREGQAECRAWRAGRVEQAGRGGRPGFDGGPTLSLCEAATNELSGRAMTVHLAWSGPFRLACERATDGSGQVLAERLLAPGEVRLQPGEQLELPAAWIALSDTGWTGVSHLFHGAIRSAAPARRRLVHFNTWEARYFDFDLASCQDLARSAASLGVERFVLDDGWFKGRRDDRTSLGDWTVDPLPFPDGLQPLIDTVHAQGMRFGLWVEPEMVSPDSDLYRAHPDWVLGYPDPDLATGRNQLVLDLSLPEASDFVFNALSALLESYPIDYLKWDCNRDLYPASRGGVERAGAQTQALYALLARLRAAHPVEIESCASGGGRIDAGIARHTDRFWASDATDAIDRLRIQRSASLIMPVERLGAHVGPSPNPMTGRPVPMAFRVLSAFFGHFGVEADPDRLNAEDADVLRRGIQQYKLHRDWMLTGDLIRLEAPDFDPDIQMLIGEDQAMLRIMRIETPPRPLTRSLRLAGLDPRADYDLTEIVLSGEAARWPIGRYPGAGLMREGLDLDPGRALSGRLIHLERAG